ncbi:sugar ABC transporter ATP-binding protein [soil metagenome]
MTDGAAPAPVGVEITELSKSYGDTVALAGLDLAAHPGEILGVAGPNGAGKSTMIKILAGETGADSGRILIDGRPWSAAFGDRGVAVVHQEPQLFPNLTVAENLLVGRERGRFLRHGVDEAERRLMSDLAISEVADRPLEKVTLAIQQRTEICRALAQDARVFLFDEPNSALTDEESADLFRRMHALADAGRVVILVSHRLAELVAHCKRVAVILDGRCARILEAAALTQDGIARELVVRQPERDSAAVERGSHGDETSLRLTAWTHGRGEFRDVHLDVHVGEIVGLVGVEGSGARELVRSIAGFEHGTGHVEVAGRTGAAAASSETGFVSADRQASLFSNLSVGDNLVARLSREIAGPSGALRRGRMARIARAARDRFQVKAADLAEPIRSLSGGNQQKVAIAAAIIRRPEVLVLEEPTRGVDVGSKREIYRLLREYAGEGHAIVMYCTEVPEVFEVADRVHVVSDGLLSEPLLVPYYADVQSLASDITKLERHGMAVPANPPANQLEIGAA